MFLFLALVVIHIAAAAIVFGLPAGLVGGVRRALSTGESTAVALAANEARRKGKISNIFAIVTLVTGILLIFGRGGFGAVSTNFHVAMVLMLAAIIFSFVWMKPAGNRLVALAESQPLDQDAIRSIMKKLAIGGGILHAAWLALLILMFYRF